MAKEISSGHPSCRYVKVLPQLEQKARDTKGEDRYSVATPEVKRNPARATVSHPNACAPELRRHDRQWHSVERYSEAAL
jgi:hypothetical protein